MTNKYYTIKFRASVRKDLLKVPKDYREKIIKKIESLKTNPRNLGSVKLHDSLNQYRVRQGEYRIIYQIEDNILMILIIKIGHRQGVYKT